MISEQIATDIPKVAVLMSTYNGEKYIKEQIDSILAQTEVDVYLYVRDDCSNDSTTNIVEKYISKNPDRIFLKKGENLGPGHSFMKLFYEVPHSFDYYAYSDQDDIWLEDKLKTAVNKIRNYSKPCLYCSNQTIYRDGKSMGRRFETKPPLSLKAHLCWNELSGCTMVFNNNLAGVIYNIFCPGEFLQYRLHDTWTLLLALIYGLVIYDEDSYILYRIHENNTVGIKKTSLLKKIRRYIKSDAGRRLRSKTAKVLLENCEIAKEDELAVLSEFADYRKSFLNRIQLINDDEIRSRSGEKKFLLAIKVMLNLF